MNAAKVVCHMVAGAAGADDDGTGVVKQRSLAVDEVTHTDVHDDDAGVDGVVCATKLMVRCQHQHRHHH